MSRSNISNGARDLVNGQQLYFVIYWIQDFALFMRFSFALEIKKIANHAFNVQKILKVKTLARNGWM